MSGQVNKQQIYLKSKYIAFVNHFKTVCDPQGLIWYIGTGRMGTSELSEILEIIGVRISRDSREELIHTLQYYGKNEIKTMIDDKPRINKRIKDIALKWGNEIANRHALYRV